MNTKMHRANATGVCIAPVSETLANTAVLLVCAALAVLATTAALLLLTLPSAPDAVASPGRAGVAYAERPAGQVIADWVDGLGERDLALWRLRSSD
jgi:hypothetical protein